MAKLNPPGLSSVGDYVMWKKELDIWQMATEVAKEKQAAQVISVLQGDYKRVALEMELSDIGSDNGFALLKAHLDKSFKKDSNDLAFETYLAFEEIRRAPEEGVNEFIIRFDRAQNAAKSIQMVYPDIVLGFKLMRAMSLSENDQKMVMTACTEITYSLMQPAIRRIVGSSGSSASGSSIVVKQEAFYSNNRKFNPNYSQKKNYQVQHPNNNGPAYSKNNQYRKNNYNAPQVQGQNQMQNPRDKNGNVMRCFICESYYHMAKDCPHKKPCFYTKYVQGDIEIEPEVKFNKIGQNVKQHSVASVQVAYMSESLGCAILDTACTKTVCGEAWLNDFMKRCKTDLKFFPTTSFYVFGDGDVVQARKKVFLPLEINGNAFDVSCDVVPDNVPFLFSQETMQGTETVIDMKQGRVTMFGKEVPISKTSSGLTLIDVVPPIEIENTFEAFAEEAETVFVCKLIEDKLDKIGIRKLHAQLGHASFEKMKRLLLDAGVNNPDSLSTLKEVIDLCEICKVHKKPSAKPCTSFPRARSVNQCVAIDLHQLDASTYYLHMIDEFSRFSQACIVRSKKPSEIIDALSEKWLSLFGCPALIFSDNGGEFCAKEFQEWAERFNIEHKTSAGNSPFSNGVVERHNAVITLMMEKLKEEFPKIKLETILCWACSAKNALSTVAGFSPNQLMFGTNTYLPGVLNSNLPALESSTSSQTVADHLNTMHAARKMFLDCDSSNRIMTALKKPLRTYSSPVTTGDKVYYKDPGNTKWKGPATVIGQESAVIFLRQGSFVVRVHHSRVMPVNSQFNQDVDNQIPIPVTRVDQSVEPVNNDDLRLPDVFSEVITETPVVVEEITQSDVSEEEVPSSLEAVVDIQVEDPESEEPTSPVLAAEKVRIVKTPVIKVGSTIMFVDNGEQYEAEVLSRGGKAKGRYANHFNVLVRETGQEVCLDVSKLDEFVVLNEDQGSPTKDFIYDLNASHVMYSASKDSFAGAKQAEIAKWSENNVFSEVSISTIDARKVISCTWVKSDKDGEKKARLVARGYLEDTSNIASKSPTCTKEGLRLLLCIIGTHEWTIQALDIKSAFLQGNQMERVVYLKPPKEAGLNPDTIWKLNKCVYGLVDASLEWYQRVSDFMIDQGGIRSKDPAIFYWKEDDKLVGVLTVHVDDFMFAGNQSFLVNVISKVRSEFAVKVEFHTNFTYLGLEINQQGDHIALDQKKYIIELEYIPTVATDLSTRELTSDEKNILKAKLGQLLWVSNQSRPDISFKVCYLSTKVKDATVNDILECNKVIKILKSNNDVSVKHLHLGSGGHCSEVEFIVFSDASFKNLFNGASQGGYIVFIKRRDSPNATPLLWKSKKLKRIVRSTLFAETYALLDAIDDCIFVRRLTAQLLGVEDDDIIIKCYTDSKTLVDNSVSDKLVDDKRLRDEIACLKETLKLDNVSLSWVDKKIQVADVLTKAVASSALLLNTLNKGRLEMI